MSISRLAPVAEVVEPEEQHFPTPATQTHADAPASFASLPHTSTSIFDDASSSTPSSSPSSQSLAPSFASSSGSAIATLSTFAQPTHPVRRNEHLAVLLPKHLWKSDNSASKCETFHCPKRFSLLERRHHCRKCGGIFCATCSTHTTPLLDTTNLAFFHPPKGKSIFLFASEKSEVIEDARVCDYCWRVFCDEDEEREIRAREKREWAEKERWIDERDRVWMERTLGVSPPSRRTLRTQRSWHSGTSAERRGPSRLRRSYTNSTHASDESDEEQSPASPVPGTCSSAPTHPPLAPMMQRRQPRAIPARISLPPLESYFPNVTTTSSSPALTSTSGHPQTPPTTPIDDPSLRLPTASRFRHALRDKLASGPGEGLAYWSMCQRTSGARAELRSFDGGEGSGATSPTASTASGSDSRSPRRANSTTSSTSSSSSGRTTRPNPYVTPSNPYGIPPSESESRTRRPPIPLARAPWEIALAECEARERERARGRGGVQGVDEWRDPRTGVLMWRVGREVGRV